jgi:transposase InsO family protein
MLMPWTTVKPMDQKILFISDCLRELETPFSHLCKRYNISRKTGYKWLKCYYSNGIDGLSEASRKPHYSPHKISFVVRQEIIKLRTQSFITPGAKKIQAKLKTLYPDSSVPSRSSIYNILNRQGLIQKRRKRSRAYHRYPKPLHRSSAANELWSVDFKGQFKLDTGQWCFPLTLMDDYSRYLLGCEGQKSVSTKPTKSNFKQLFKKYGLPKRIRSDNGVPFASSATAGLSTLSIWWIKLGIHPERIEPGRPEQNGKHERMHRTLKKYTTYPSARSFKAQQQRFEDFKTAFNYERPHEALAFKTPSDCYQASTISLPIKIPKPDYPSHFSVRKVLHSSVISYLGGAIYISHLLKDEYIALEEFDHDRFNVYFYHYPLGRIDLQHAAQKSVKYTTIEPMPSQQ